MKVLFITEKYVDQPQFGPTNNLVNLIGSYVNSGLGTFEHLYISTDFGDISSIQRLDIELTTRDFDIAVVSIYPPISPSIWVTKLLGKRLVICWWDTVYTTTSQILPINNPHDCFRMFLINPYENRSYPYLHTLEEYSKYCTNIVFDYGCGKIQDNIFGLPVPQDQTIYKKSNDKKIDVSFVGSIERQGRREILERISDNNINIYVSGGRGHNKSNLSFEDYGRIISESKICLNIQLGSRVPQRKGRTFEISACGTFMLANYPEVFTGTEGSFFEEGIHYDSFDEDNVVEKIKFWLENDSERERIAENMYNLHQNKYSPVPWWENIFNITNTRL